MLTAIHPAFTAKKSRILNALAVPASEYTDLSPKGSVDEGIRDLIGDLNDLEGLVTTSSCAGRISVFLEGRQVQAHGGDEHKGLRGQTVVPSVPGGKGNGGQWIFVSHEPFKLSDEAQGEDDFLIRKFSMSVASEQSNRELLETRPKRFLKFQFEPMILHVMSASLLHARPVLSAAISAGFRESGVQSLKNLDDPLAFPMVAVRTTGLALSSVIGYMHENDSETRYQSLVSEQHLRILLETANERFRANTERIARFQSQLIATHKVPNRNWEEAEDRRARKRAEGLQQQENCHSKTPNNRREDDSDSGIDGIGHSIETM